MTQNPESNLNSLLVLLDNIGAYSPETATLIRDTNTYAVEILAGLHSLNPELLGKVDNPKGGEPLIYLTEEGKRRVDEILEKDGFNVGEPDGLLSEWVPGNKELERVLGEIGYLIRD